MSKQVAADLLRLIQSMTPAEKRSFALSSARYKSEHATSKNYLTLYHQLAELQSGEPLPVVQEDRADYLIEMLTESLAQQHHSWAELNMRHQLSEAIVLYRRGLEKRAVRLFEKLYALSVEASMYEFALDLIATQQHMITSVDSTDVISNLIKKKNQLLEALIVYQKFDDLLVRLFRAMSSNNLPLLRKLILNPLFRKPSSYRRNEIQRLYLLAHAYHTLGDFKQTEKHHLRLLQLFEESPIYISVHIHTYLVLCLNSGLLAYKMLQPDQILKTIDALQQLPKRMKGLIVTIDHDRITRYSLDLQLRHMVISGKPERIVNYLNQIRRCLQEDKKIEPYRINYLRYFTALAFYQMKKYKDALPWLQSVVDEKRKGYYNQKTYGLAFLLRADCHWHLGHDEIAEPMIRSFRRTKFFEPLRAQNQFQRLLAGFGGKQEAENWLL
jgi:tetratricopeptide (TPR) repeat protein